jgi:hypothetical protein
MKTSNFDLLFEIKEDLINRALAIAFYTSAMPTIVEGTVAVSKKLPPEMKYLGDMDFRLRLKEPPTVDAIEDGAVRLLFNIEFSVTMLHGLRNEFDITASIAAVPVLSPADEHMVIDLCQGQVDKIVFDDKYKIPARTIKALDEVIKAALKSHLLDKLENFDLTPFLKPLDLPDPVEGIDAVVMWNNGKAYFFKGETYIRYDITARKVDNGYPAPISPNWHSIWPGGVDSAMVYPNGKAYFFKEGWYMRYDIAGDSVDPNYPAKIEDGWKGVWTDGIDAAVVWNNGKAYFFKGAEYIRYDIAADKADDDYPKDIARNWPGVWTDGIDSVVMWNNGKAYFFKGDEYIQYDVAADRADPGYPVKIIANWEKVWTGKLPLPVRPGGFKTIGQRVFAAGLNFFQNPLGDMVPVQDYTGGNDMWVGIPERTMHQVFDYIWANTAWHLKRRHWNETYDVLGDKARDYINTFNDIMNEAVPKLFTLGVLSEDVNIDYLKCTASATVSVDKPEFDLLPGNSIRINNLRANINIYLRVYTKITITTTVDTSGWFPDELTPWEDDITNTSSTEITLIDASFHFSEALKEVKAELICDLTKGIYGRITSLKADIDLGIDLVSDAATWLANKIAELILKFVPPIRLLPPLIEKQIAVPAKKIVIQKDIVTIEVNDYVAPKTLTFQIEPGPVTIDDQELTAAVSLHLAELPRTVFSLPLFVANRNPKRMEVHRLECIWVDEIDQAYRVGYYILNDALHDGYDGCKYCLPEYHTR